MTADRLRRVKPMKKVVLGLLLLPILLILVSLFLPSTYRVERSLVIQAPPGAIYPWVAQLKRWPEWTVWNTAMDPTLTYTYSGPAEGAGAEMSWTAKSGPGALKLTSADPKTGVQYDLNFDNGKFVSKGGVALAAAEGGTRATFYNEGALGFNPVARYLGLFFDKMMGGDFDKNLAGLKQKAEAKAQ